MSTYVSVYLKILEYYSIYIMRRTCSKRKFHETTHQILLSNLIYVPQKLGNKKWSFLFHFLAKNEPLFICIVNLCCVKRAIILNYTCKAVIDDGSQLQHLDTLRKEVSGLGVVFRGSESSSELGSNVSSWVASLKPEASSTKHSKTAVLDLLYLLLVVLLRRVVKAEWIVSSLS